MESDADSLVAVAEVVPFRWRSAILEFASDREVLHSSEDETEQSSTEDEP